MATSERGFAQVDVFVSGALSGNPVAVVLDASGMDEATMASFANWTNLSETTFVLPPTDPAADYRLRIFCPSAEMAFAGHPTLGSAHAWLASGGTPAGEMIVQECGIGLVTIRRDGDALSFAAPPLHRYGDVDESELVKISAALGIRRDDILAAQWVDNGPGWIGLELATATEVLAVTPNFSELTAKVGLIGRHRDGPARYEVRAFAPTAGVNEDPVTGSLNAGLALWMRHRGVAPPTYVVTQGTVLGRSGVVHVDDDGSDVWIGGVSNTTITGVVAL